MMARYATNTSVSPDRTRGEIESVLLRYGCERFGVMTERDRAFVAFTINGLNVQIDVPLPSRDDPEFWTTDTGRERAESAAHKAYEQAVKSRWRALLLAIKAKLEAVETGISTIEQEFLPFVVLADGSTVGQTLIPHLQGQVERSEPLRLERKGVSA